MAIGEYRGVSSPAVSASEGEGGSMTLSYMGVGATKRTKIKAIRSFNHHSCSRGGAAIVLLNGRALDRLTWGSLDYKVEKATDGSGRP